MLRRIVLLLVVVAGLLAALLWHQHVREPLKVSGVVEADEIRIGSRVGGRVKAVAAQEGKAVKQGDVLVTLEPFDLLDRRAEAQAKRAELAAQLDKLIAGPRPQEIEAAKARLDAAAAQAKLAQLTYDRIKKLVAEDNASADQLDKATNDLTATQATCNAQRQELELLQAGTRKEEIAAAKAAVDEADASLAVIDRQVQELEVKAPLDGFVEALELRPGDLVAANAPVLSIMDTRAMWLRAYVPEGRLQFEVGHKVDVTLDSIPGKRFAGHVTFISREGEFTPGNVQTPEERSKQVFRIKVALDEGSERLRPGMAADVWLEK